ncbi:hypothetical protein HPK19_24615 [Arthrobacter citreus]|nr:hypothetical protein HPK19_24615 [Arthrobacter citreus]
MKKKISVSWLIVLLFIFYLISTFVGGSTFEDFLARNKNIHSDRTNHTEGWTGPNNEKLDWDSSEENYRIIYVRYAYTFIKPNKKIMEVSAIKIFGIWIDTTKSKQ